MIEFADGSHGGAEVVVDCTQGEAELGGGFFAEAVFVAGREENFFLAGGQAPHCFLNTCYAFERFMIKMSFLPGQHITIHERPFEEQCELFFQVISGFITGHIFSEKSLNNIPPKGFWTTSRC